MFVVIYCLSSTFCLCQAPLLASTQIETAWLLCSMGRVVLYNTLTVMHAVKSCAMHIHPSLD